MDIGSCSRANCFYHQTFQVARRIFPAEIIKYALVESPFVLGAHYDPQGSRFIILMEDLETRDFRINNFLNDDNVPVLKSLLDNLARLHGHFWQTPRFEKDLNWVENQLSGGVEELLDGAIYDHIIEELTREKYKREFIDELGATASELHAGVKAIKRHQATLPQTLLHGDAHLGNSYVLPNGDGGLLDYQLTARGFAMHDVGYLIHSALSVKGRRRHEHDLLQYYRDRLSAHGVDDAPSLADLWVEYRRSALYTFYMGWLPAPRENYGLEACVLANHRAKTACVDLKCMELIP